MSWPTADTRVDANQFDLGERLNPDNIRFTTNFIWGHQLSKGMQFANSETAFSGPIFYDPKTQH